MQLGCDLVVHAPLRITNVMAVLQAAALQLNVAAQHEPFLGQQALFKLIGEGFHTNALGRLVVPISSGQQISLSFVGQLLHTAMPLELLLGGGLYGRRSPWRESGR